MWRLMATPLVMAVAGQRGPLYAKAWRLAGGCGLLGWPSWPEGRALIRNKSALILGAVGWGLEAHARVTPHAPRFGEIGGYMCVHALQPQA